jgi:hypothetical protein
MTEADRRRRIAIATVLRQMGGCSYQDLALRAGEGLASDLMEMTQAGEVERIPDPKGGPAIYRVKGEDSGKSP